MGFAEDRVRSGVEKLKKYKDNGIQTRIDTFFQVVKRPREEEEAAAKLKKQKPGQSKAKAKPGAKKAPAKKAATTKK
ncbi:hypothetical protein DFA_05293 [Cavenderia fasciculata]|uniref:Uncharacterized protein n=1 Tax=Cavenderia fasciculata TaxID=261658 RepID=F4PNV8_CACFS|nr:uncharacterized protein DFA_05293 [Cavenderia fasciculata]EGG23161.1 hypothetical protein DFA_05293 [Cavenderia fasciculata]|eukprot:XP_004361012.1 hypothetical protein DFA_05293 [Cavenderia fasciculata]